MQGVFAGFFTPLARSAVVKISNHDNLALNLSNIQTIGMLGPALGPLIGGYLAFAYNWRYVFYLNIPLCVIVGALIAIYFNENFSEKSEKYAFDYFGYFLLSSALVTFLCIVDMFASQSNLNKFSKIYSLVMVVIFLISTVLLFFHVRMYKKKQILDFYLLKENKKFKFYTLISICSRQYTGAIGLILILFFSSYKNFNHIQSGYILLTYGTGLWASKLFMKLLLNRYKPEYVFGVVIKLLIFCNIIIFFLISYSESYILYFSASFILGALISSFHGYLNILIFSCVPKKKSIPASSFSSLIMHLSQSSSIAIFSITFYCIARVFDSKYDVLYVVSLLLLFLVISLILKRKISLD